MVIDLGKLVLKEYALLPFPRSSSYSFFFWWNIKQDGNGRGELDIETASGFIGITWSYKNDMSEMKMGKFYHNCHLLVNDLIMKIKYTSREEDERASRCGRTWASCRYISTSFAIVFYYSNNRKSYFPRYIFTYFSRLVVEMGDTSYFPLIT